MSALAPDDGQDSKVKYHVDAIVAHATEPRLLLRSSTEGWMLPQVTLYEPILRHVEPVRQALRDQLGLEASVLRCAQVDWTGEAVGRIAALLILESLNRHWQPPQDGQWVGRADLDILPLARPEQRPIMATWLQEDESGLLPPLRVPWARRGWFARATAWFQQQAEYLEMPIRGPVEQVRQWGLSSILRGRTVADDLYLKASPPLFAQEPRITHVLAALYPDVIPRPLLTEPEQGWMVLRDLGGRPLVNASLTDWEAAFRLLGSLQRDSATRTATLLAAGCADRRLETMDAQIEALMSDEEALSALSAAERAHLRFIVPHLTARIADLAACGLPQTLVHGDWHGGNIIARSDGGYTVFDWATASVAHPFFDLVAMLDDASLGPLVGQRDHLRDVYLATWQDYSPPTELIAACELGIALGAVHDATTYQQIEASLEPTAKWEVAGVLPGLLRQILATAWDDDGSIETGVRRI